MLWRLWRLFRRVRTAWKIYRGRPLRIYIAGPYSAETQRKRLQNTNLAIDTAIFLWYKGHYPYVPHLTHFLDARLAKLVDWRPELARFRLEYEDYISWDREYQDACDALYLRAESPGALREVERARKRGQVIFRHGQDVPIGHREKRYPLPSRESRENGGLRGGCGPEGNFESVHPGKGSRPPGGPRRRTPEGSFREIQTLELEGAPQG